jgi:hypothetical protein
VFSSVLVIVTVALGTTAPLASVTVPSSVPKVDCANAIPETKAIASTDHAILFRTEISFF